MAAGELSKAVAVVWGPGESASVEAIKKQFMHSQRGEVKSPVQNAEPGLWDVPVDLYEKIIIQINNR